MPSYLVALADGNASHLTDGHNRAIVDAADATEAKNIAASHFALRNVQNEASLLTIWTDAETTATEITKADWEDFVFTLTLSGAAAQVVDPIVVIYTGIAADDVDDVGLALETATNLTEIAAATYDDSGNVLTVAAIADDMGDGTLTVSCEWNGVPVAFFGTIVHEGIAAADVDVDLPADALVIPTVLDTYGER